MKNAIEALAARSFEPDAIKHRLSWFVTLQGLLFLSFVLVDKREFLLTSVLVCAGVAMCVPSIASAYTSPRLRNWLRLFLAVFWAVLGTAHFIMH